MHPYFASTFVVISSLCFGFLAVRPAWADLYRYENQNGEVVLTTEKRSDLKLIEVIRDRSRPARRPVAQGDSKGRQNAHPVSEKGASAQAPAADRTHLYDAYIAEASAAYGIPEAFIRAVIKIESNFNPRAVSSAGAMGLMQLMPATAEHMRVSDPFDPRDNIMGGTRYLRRLSDRYDGDINLVLSGYHAGPGKVEKAGGIPFAKTQQYVRNVYSWYVRYREEAAKGVSSSAP